MKTTEITCAKCGIKSSKRKAEIDRQVKKGKTVFYCSINCASKNSCSHLEKYHGLYNQNLVSNNRLDEFTSFKWYIKVVRKNSKSRKHEYNIDCKYLKKLWEEQNGICPFTNKKLILRTHSNNDITKSPYQASLDRIDNSIGYIKGNVRFVALIYNYAKNTFSDQEVIDFCKNVANKNKNYSFT
jgi:hypothetical protein